MGRVSGIGVFWCRPRASSPGPAGDPFYTQPFVGAAGRKTYFEAVSSVDAGALLSTRYWLMRLEAYFKRSSSKSPKKRSYSSSRSSSSPERGRKRSRSGSASSGDHKKRRSRSRSTERRHGSSGSSNSGSSSSSKKK